jgi:hypothetical protein
MDSDNILAERLAALAFDLAGQRVTGTVGPFWYDNMLSVLRDTITGASDAKKTQQLVRLAAGNRSALHEARHRVLAKHSPDDTRAKLAADLLRDALLVPRR